MDPKVEDYLKRQGEERKVIIEKIRALILAHFPSIKETGMAEGIWYEGKFYIASMRDHVNLGVGVNGLSEEELKHFEGKGKSMRHLKFYSADDINEADLLPLLQLVYEKSICEKEIVWRK